MVFSSPFVKEIRQAPKKLFDLSGSTIAVSGIAYLIIAQMSFRHVCESSGSKAGRMRLGIGMRMRGGFGWGDDPT